MSPLDNLAGMLVLTALVPTVVCSQDFAELFRQGSRQFAENQVDAATATFQRVVELRPDHAPSWKALGVISASRGDFERAAINFRNACERQPSLSDACLYYGRTLYLLNRFQPAIQVLRRVVLTEAHNAEAFRLLALSLEGLGESADAGIAFREAIRLHRPGSSGSSEEDPGIDYAVFLFRQGRAEPALEPVAAVLKRYPDSARAHLELGCILLALDRLPDAGAHLERAVALNPENPRAHLLLGKVYLRLGKSDAAEEHLRQGSRTVK